MQIHQIHLRPPFENIREEGGDDVTAHSTIADAALPNLSINGIRTCPYRRIDALKLQTTIAANYRINLLCPHPPVLSYLYK